MANLFRSLISRRQTDEVARFSTQDYLRWLSTAWNGLVQPMYPSTSTYSQGRPAERIENSFTGYVYGAYKVNPIVYGLMTRRSSVFSEARFMWREVLDGKPGDLFWSDALTVLSRPWPNGTTGELLTRMIQDVDLAGNSYIVNEGDRLRRLRPDWVQIILSGNPLTDPDVDVVGYTFTPGGPDAGEPVAYMPDDVCHWSPIPDPDAQYRGMSWLTPVVREIQGDQAATSHKLAFYRNGASLGPIIRLPKEMTPEQFRKFIEADQAAHAGAENAYRTMYVGGGADVTLAAANMQQLDFKAVQGAGETRLCVASGVPAVIAGVSEGLSGSSLNAGNYGTAKRSFADGTLRTLWRSACAALSTILEVPEDAELWYDESHIAFLREDQEDQARIDQTTMASIVSAITGGFEPDGAVTTIAPRWSKTLKHSGLMSVQLTPPGSEPTDTIDGTDVPPPDDTTPPGQARSQSDLDEEFYEVLWALDEMIERAFNPDQARIGKGHVGGGEFGSKITPLLEKWLAAGGHGDPLGEAGVSRQTIVKAAKAHGVDVPPRMPLTALKAALYAAVHDRAVAKTGGTLHPEVTEHQHRVRRVDAARPLAHLARDIDSASTLSEPERSQVIGEHIDGAEQAGELTPDQALKLRGMLHGDGPEVRRVEVENRIRAAYRDLLAEKPAGGNRLLSLADLRDRLAEDNNIRSTELEVALKTMIGEPGVNLIPESNQSALTPRQRSGAVRIGGQDKHHISIADPADRPLPASPTGASKVKAAVTRLNKANGVTPIGNADKTTTFDPSLHRPLVHDTAADSIAPGTRVRVVQQGHALDGDTVEMAVVAPVARPAKKAAPAKPTVQTDAGGRITPEEAGRIMLGDKGYEQKVAKKAAPAKATARLSVADHVANLRATDTHAEAAAYLDSHPHLTAKELREIAEQSGTVAITGTTKARLRQAIIEGTGGFREDSAVMLPGGFKGGMVPTVKLAAAQAAKLTPAELQQAVADGRVTPRVATQAAKKATPAAASLTPVKREVGHGDGDGLVARLNRIRRTGTQEEYDHALKAASDGELAAAIAEAPPQRPGFALDMGALTDDQVAVHTERERRDRLALETSALPRTGPPSVPELIAPATRDAALARLREMSVEDLRTLGIRAGLGPAVDDMSHPQLVSSISNATVRRDQGASLTPVKGAPDSTTLPPGVRLEPAPTRFGNVEKAFAVHVGDTEVGRVYVQKDGKVVPMPGGGSGRGTRMPDTPPDITVEQAAKALVDYHEADAQIVPAERARAHVEAIVPDLSTNAGGNRLLHESRRSVVDALHTSATLAPTTMLNLDGFEFAGADAHRGGMFGWGWGEAARYDQFGQSIAMSPHWRTDYGRMHRAGVEGHESGWYTPTPYPGAAGHTVAHEYGHHVVRTIGFNGMDEEQAGELYPALERALDLPPGTIYPPGSDPEKEFINQRLAPHSDVIRRKISGYAAQPSNDHGHSQLDELLAEVWQEYSMMGTKSRPHITAIGEIMARLAEQEATRQS